MAISTSGREGEIILNQLSGGYVPSIHNRPYGAYNAHPDQMIVSNPELILSKSPEARPLEYSLPTSSNEAQKAVDAAANIATPTTAETSAAIVAQTSPAEEILPTNADLGNYLPKPDLNGTDFIPLEYAKHSFPTAEEVFSAPGMNPPVEAHTLPMHETQGVLDQIQQTLHNATNGHELAGIALALGVAGAGLYYISKDR